MLIKRKIAARHGTDEIGFRHVLDVTAFDLGPITKNGIIITNLEDFFHLVADENNGMIAIKQTTDNLEDTLHLHTRQG